MSMPATPMRMVTTRPWRTKRRKQASQDSTQIKSPVEGPGFFAVRHFAVRHSGAVIFFPSPLVGEGGVDAVRAGLGVSLPGCNPPPAPLLPHPATPPPKGRRGKPAF